MKHSCLPDHMQVEIKVRFDSSCLKSYFLLLLWVCYWNSRHSSPFKELMRVILNPCNVSAIQKHISKLSQTALLCNTILGSSLTHCFAKRLHSIFWHPVFCLVSVWKCVSQSSRGPWEGHSSLWPHQWLFVGSGRLKTKVGIQRFSLILYNLVSICCLVFSPSKAKSVLFSSKPWHPLPLMLIPD